MELIVLDILLPDGDGLTLCREIKENYDIPILFLSALGENEDIVQGLTAGGDDYLPKPFDPDELLSRVRAILRRSEAYQPTVLAYGDLTVSEIADKLRYSSVAHLSAQFRAQTGMSPTEFRRLKGRGLKPLDEE